jgi:excisionase family DNA binding protein
MSSETRAGTCPAEVSLDMPESQLLSIPDFCGEFKLSRSFAYGLLQDGTLTGVKVGRLTRIRRSDAEAWVAALATYKHATPPAHRSNRKSKPQPAEPRRGKTTGQPPANLKNLSPQSGHRSGSEPRHGKATS